MQKIMRKLRLLACGFLVITFNQLEACDVCGCSSMSIGLDNLGLSSGHLIGMRYSIRQFNAGSITDYFHQAEIIGSYQLSKRIRLSASIPYLKAQRQQTEIEDATLSGLGDASLRVRYELIHLKREKSEQQLYISGGLNLPTGVFEDRENSLLAPNFQTGTGSWDYTLGFQYQLKKGQWLWAIQSVYLVNTLNSHAYKFGNQVNTQLVGGRKIELKKAVLMPSLSLAWEHFDRDVNSRGFYQYGTGGDGLNMLAGLSLFSNQWVLHLKGGTNLYNSSNSSYTPGFQGQLSINYQL